MHLIYKNVFLSESINILKKNGIVFFFKRVIIYILHKLKIINKHKKVYCFKNPFLTESISVQIQSFQKKPIISIFILVYGNSKINLDKTFFSLKNQWYPNYEIILVYSNNNNRNKENNFLKENVLTIINIHELTINLIKKLKGDYVAIIHDGDQLTSDALYENVKSINEFEPDLIYSDHDIIKNNKKSCDPFYKSDFNEEMLLSYNYIRNFTVFKKKLFYKALSIDSYTFNLYGIILKVCELTSNIHHIRKVLYHENIVNVHDMSFKSNKTEIVASLKRRGIDALLLPGLLPNLVRVRRKLRNKPLVSIIIPFKDQPDFLNLCISSILEKSSYENIEIIGVSNNSEEPRTFKLMAQFEEKDSRINFITYDIPFNYSKINNHAASFAKGRHIILLNNDTEIISHDWIESLLEYSQNDNVGAVGGLLLYPDDSIQHAGVILGIGVVTGHSHRHLKFRKDVCHLRPYISQHISAVTAACLMVKTELFKSVGGLNDTELAVTFNDIDFCLRLREKGYLNVYTPYCQAYHYESKSRGYDNTPEKQIRFNKEAEFMKKRYEKTLRNGDPYYNPNLTVKHEHFGVKSGRPRLIFFDRNKCI